MTPEEQFRLERKAIAPVNATGMQGELPLDIQTMLVLFGKLAKRVRVLEDKANGKK
jgi:hypothetical protein